jgi:hypothetical protein
MKNAVELAPVPLNSVMDDPKEAELLVVIVTTLLPVAGFGLNVAVTP